jgi:hypothetical protein
MSTYDFVHLAILAVGGEVNGKTKLQKTVYFLGILTGHIGELGYGPHFYGPYSPDVEEALDRLSGLGFLDQTERNLGYSESGFEVVRYDMRLSRDGKTIGQQKAKNRPVLWRKLQRAVEVLTKAGDLDYMRLSIAAKAFFMLGEKKGKATTKELEELAPRFGWSVTSKQMREAFEYLRSLELVALSAE